MQRFWTGPRAAPHWCASGPWSVTATRRPWASAPIRRTRMIHRTRRRPGKPQDTSGMSDTKNSGDKTISVPSKTLSLKRPVEQGVVRQSFSHGRSKAVVVEKVKRRIIGPGDKPDAAHAAAQVAPKPVVRPVEAPAPTPAPAAPVVAAPAPAP